MASRQGKHIAKGAQALSERMEDGMYTAPAKAEGIQGGAQAVQFRRKFDAKDSYDDYMNTKMQLMDSKGMTPFGQTYYDERTGRWLERKAAVAEAINFDSYFNIEFNKNDLASRQFAQKINPEFYRQREQEMNDRAAMIVKLKNIQLRGPQSTEDLYLLWSIDSGRVKLPKDWDRIAPAFSDTKFSAEDDKANITNMTQGLIRMPLFLNVSQKKDNAIGNKAAGAWGNKDLSSDFFFSGDVAAKNPALPTQQDQPSVAQEFLGKLAGAYGVKQ